MSPEEVIARAIHDLFDPYDKAAAEVTSRILSALKSAGLVVVPEEPTEAMIVAGITERHLSGVPDAWSLATVNIYRAMIRAATSPGAPVPADPARHG